MRYVSNIVIDLDQTLADSAPLLYQAVNYFLKQLERLTIEFSNYKNFIGKGILKKVEQLLNHSGSIPRGNLNKHLNLFRALHDQKPLSSIILYEALLVAVEMIFSRIAAFILKANKPAREILCGFNLMDYFEGFLRGDSRKVLKLDPEMSFFAIREFEAGPLIYITDSQVGSIAAKNTNTKFLTFSVDYPKMTVDKIAHDSAFNNHKEILKLTNQILSELD